MLGQTETVERALVRLGEIAPNSDTWSTDFAKSVIAYATSIVSTVSDLAVALVGDLSQRSAESLRRASEVQKNLLDRSMALVPLIRAAQDAEAKKAPSVTATGLRAGVFGALQTAAGGWKELEGADRGRATLDALSGEYRRERERLTKRFWDLGNGLYEVPAPPAVPAPPGAKRPSRGLAVLGIAALALGASGLAIWLGRRLG